MANEATDFGRLGGAHVGQAFDYWVDACQRTILFWDVMRKRGNIALEHYREGKPPVLKFDYETVLDGRTFERPVNYAAATDFSRRAEHGSTPRSGRS